MGHSMAGHLLAAGYPLSVHTRTKSCAEDLLARGAAWADSPATAAGNAQFVFICVPDTPDVQKVILGENGVLPSLGGGQIVIDHSTISPAATREMATAVAERGGQLLDAPVSGGDSGGAAHAFHHGRWRRIGICQNGSHTAVHGKDHHPLRAVRCGTTHQAGESDPGLRHKSGRERGTRLRPRQRTGRPEDARCRQRRRSGFVAALNLGPRMLKGDFAPGFMIKLQEKDLRLALTAADQRSIRLRATTLVQQLFSQGITEGRERRERRRCFRSAARMQRVDREIGNSPLKRQDRLNWSGLY